MEGLAGNSAFEKPVTCFLGLGNLDFGDDGFGVRLARELSQAGVQEVWIAGTEPEKYLGQIAARAFDDLVFLDAVEFGGAPGSLIVLEGNQIQTRFPQISTHKISLGTLAAVVQANGRTRVWLLGVQPESLKESRGLTPAIEHTLQLAKALLQGGGLQEVFREAGCPAMEEEHVC